MQTTLKATARTQADNVKKIREEGNIPAVVYGAGQKNLSITVSFRDFVNARKAVGESGVLTLELPDGKVSALIHEISDDPVKSVPQHVDFLAVDLSKPITVHVPIEFIGVAPAVKGGLGTLVKSFHEIELTGLSKDLPQSITVDIAGLDAVNSHISVGSIKLPAGVTATAKEGDIIVSVAALKEEKEEVTAPIDFASIEVEKKGKKEEEAAPAE